MCNSWDVSLCLGGHGLDNRAYFALSEDKHDFKLFSHHLFVAYTASKGHKHLTFSAIWLCVDLTTHDDDI